MTHLHFEGSLQIDRAHAKGRSWEAVSIAIAWAQKRHDADFLFEDKSTDVRRLVVGHIHAFILLQ
jgi:hypothetical protein